MHDIDRCDYRYTALFCEENIWHLADSLIKQGSKPSDLLIAFISNTDQQVVIFNQKSGHDNEPVIWDYHVVLLRKENNVYYIYDFDTLAEFTITADYYLQHSFPNHLNIKQAYQPQFRLINAETYLSQFSSDRSHMLGIIADNQFPNYPPIEADTLGKTLYFQQLINFNQPLVKDEDLLDINDFLKFVSSSSNI